MKLGVMTPSRFPLQAVRALEAQQLVLSLALEGLLSGMPAEGSGFWRSGEEVLSKEVIELVEEAHTYAATSWSLISEVVEKLGG